MRLISKFKDYYDGLQDPTDKHHVYVRMPMHLTPDDPVCQTLRTASLHMPDGVEWIHKRRLGQDEADRVAKQWNKAVIPAIVETQDWVGSRVKKLDIRFETMLLLFCGKLYRGVRYTEMWANLRRRGDGVYNLTPVTKVWWNVDAFSHDTIHSPGRTGVLTDRQIKEMRDFKDKAFTVTESKALMDLHFKTGCPVLTLVPDDVNFDELSDGLRIKVPQEVLDHEKKLGAFMSGEEQQEPQQQEQNGANDA